MELGGYERGIIRELSEHATVEAMSVVRRIAKTASPELQGFVMDYSMTCLALVSLDYLKRVGINIEEMKSG